MPRGMGICGGESTDGKDTKGAGKGWGGLDERHKHMGRNRDMEDAVGCLILPSIP